MGPRLKKTEARRKGSQNWEGGGVERGLGFIVGPVRRKSCEIIWDVGGIRIEGREGGKRGTWCERSLSEKQGPKGRADGPTEKKHPVS